MRTIVRAAVRVAGSTVLAVAAIATGAYAGHAYRQRRDALAAQMWQAANKR